MMSYWQGKVKIGDREYPRFMGAPLDGVTDSPYRRLMREFSKDELLYTEMRHVASIAHNKGVMRALDFEASERSLSFQIAANKIDHIPEACEKILSKGVDIVDLNLGCPARNVVGSGGGSFLMGHPEQLRSIVTCLRKNLPIPFTVKIRAGYKEKNGLEIAQMLQDCGVDALAVHPRLQTQKSEGLPDYALTAQIKKALSIPVMLSGDVVDFATAKMSYEKTGVDGYLIGRGILGQPWKLKELDAHARGQEFTVSMADRLQCAIKHLELMVDYYGQHGLYAFRKHVPHYLKGFLAASSVRKNVITSESVDEVKTQLAELARMSSA